MSQWPATKAKRVGRPASDWMEREAIDEIRAAFLGHYEKRLKLQLLWSELAALKNSAEAGCIADEATVESQYSLVTFDTHVIEAILTDTISITANVPQLIQALTSLRREATIANNKIQISLDRLNFR